MSLSRGKVYIASHSGIYAGNIVRNTIPAFEAALLQGADILEVDVARSLDGTLYIFHEGYEKLLFNLDRKINELTDSEISELRYKNLFGRSTEYVVDKLDDFFEHFRGRCMINLDRTWDKLPEVVAKIREHNIANQILLKTKVKSEYLSCIEELASDIQYMPVIYDEQELQLAQNYKVSLTAVEVIFESLESSLAKPEMIQKLHDSGLLLWVNAIIYSYKDQLCGGLNDDISVIKGPEYGWGKLIEMGFDIIQTDFPDSLKRFLDTLKPAN